MSRPRVSPLSNSAQSLEEYQTGRSATLSFGRRDREVTPGARWRVTSLGEELDVELKAETLRRCSECRQPGVVLVSPVRRDECVRGRKAEIAITLAEIFGPSGCAVFACCPETGYWHELATHCAARHGSIQPGLEAWQ